MCAMMSASALDIDSAAAVIVFRGAFYEPTTGN